MKVHLFIYLSTYNKIGTKSRCLRIGNLSPSHSFTVEFEPFTLAFITSGGEMKRLRDYFCMVIRLVGG